MLDFGIIHTLANVGRMRTERVRKPRDHKGSRGEKKGPRKKKKKRGNRD